MGITLPSTGKVGVKMVLYWAILIVLLGTATAKEEKKEEEGASKIGKDGLMDTKYKLNVYKIPVEANSKMTSATVLSTCKKKKLKPQCWEAAYADGNCVMTPITDTETMFGQTPRELSKIFCGKTDPTKCAETLNMFWYMKNWTSACGVTEEGMEGDCTIREKEFVSTSKTQYYAACVCDLDCQKEI